MIFQKGIIEVRVINIHAILTFDVMFKFSLDPGAFPVMFGKLSTCNHPFRPYLPNCTEWTRYRSSTGLLVKILLGPMKIIDKS